jgi:hypothetical protein
MAKRKSMKRGVQRVDVALYGDEFMAIVERYGDEAMFAAGAVVLRAAERKAPRGRTGNLAASGYVATGSRSTYVRKHGWRKEKKAPRGGAVVGFTAPHAHLVESGRRKRGVIVPTRRGGKRALNINGQIRAASHYTRMSSQPYLGPALDASMTTMVEELAAVLKRRLESEGRR